MSVSPETEWVLVTSGLIAHADGTLDGNEIERLMAMIDDRVVSRDSDWLGLLSDPEALASRYAQLPTPPADQHQALLEEAWTMAMVDGDHNSPEIAVLRRIAAGLGVDLAQLDSWRQAWSVDERTFARHVAELSAYCLAGGQPLEARDRSRLLALVGRLPTTSEEREGLMGLADGGGSDQSALAKALGTLSHSRLTRTFRLVGRLIGRAIDRQGAAGRFAEVAQAAGVLDVENLYI